MFSYPSFSPGMTKSVSSTVPPSSVINTDIVPISSPSSTSNCVLTMTGESLRKFNLKVTASSSGVSVVVTLLYSN
ncbi:MAG TPA: hypothetical protein VJ903_02920 [Clostridia bacterium]|nr:hypothetical protein [Clostridia bacterium]